MAGLGTRLKMVRFRLCCGRKQCIMGIIARRVTSSGQESSGLTRFMNDMYQVP